MRAADTNGTTDPVRARPILKWAGGKTQLLDELSGEIPSSFQKYIEPFAGGAALFFHLQHPTSVLGDTNSELLNLYRTLSKDAPAVAEKLQTFPISKEDFYRIRALNWQELSPTMAAARMIYLNRLCFNGLYRVNRQGQFNVPFGNYANPRFPSLDQLCQAGAALNRATLVESDYLTLLRQKAAKGDFVFLDPPYLPAGKYADFKRYTARQFSFEDHRQLAEEVQRLVDLGCFVVLTNADHPLVYELYGAFKVKTINTKRNINSRGSARHGKDVIVVADGRK